MDRLWPLPLLPPLAAAARPDTDAALTVGCEVCCSFRITCRVARPAVSGAEAAAEVDVGVENPSLTDEEDGAEAAGDGEEEEEGDDDSDDEAVSLVGLLVAAALTIGGLL